MGDQVGRDAPDPLRPKVPQGSGQTGTSQVSRRGHHAPFLESVRSDAHRLDRREHRGGPDHRLLIRVAEQRRWSPRPSLGHGTRLPLRGRQISGQNPEETGSHQVRGEDRRNRLPRARRESLLHGIGHVWGPSFRPSSGVLFGSSSTGLAQPPTKGRRSRDRGDTTRIVRIELAWLPSLSLQSHSFQLRSQDFGEEAAGLSFPLFPRLPPNPTRIIRSTRPAPVR